MKLPLDSSMYDNETSRVLMRLVADLVQRGEWANFGAVHEAVWDHPYGRGAGHMISAWPEFDDRCHRIILSTGKVPQGLPGGPAWTQKAIAKLQQEGVSVVNGVADPNCRVDYLVLRARANAALSAALTCLNTLGIKDEATV